MLCATCNQPMDNHSFFEPAEWEADPTTPRDPETGAWKEGFFRWILKGHQERPAPLCPQTV